MTIGRILDSKNTFTTSILFIIGVISVIHGLYGIMSIETDNVRGVKGSIKTKPFETRFLSESPFNMIRNVTEFPLDPTDKALLWHVPRDGDLSIKDIYLQCELPLFVDMSTLEGIEKAISTNLAQNEDVNLIISPLFTETLKVMTDNHKGRAFTFMRNPIERELDHYMALTRSNQIDMTIEEYVSSEYSGNNWMLRHIIGKEKGTLSLNDYERAKAILKEKFIVLFEDKIEESLDRWFRSHAGPQHNFGKWTCVGNVIKSECTREGSLRFPTYSPEYAALRDANVFDIKLYSFSKYLFIQQSTFFN